MKMPMAYEEQIAEMLRELGISSAYGPDRGLPLIREAEELVPVERDIYGRPQQLAPAAAAAWLAMKVAADQGGATLLLVSGFRSVDYQRGIWMRKLAAGEKAADILRVNAAPGYSEHHTGRAVDVTTPGCAPLAEELEKTVAFAWLVSRAASFGFSMTYPRGNEHGMIYEPWHWLWRG